jgi:hypothetical protein
MCSFQFGRTFQEYFDQYFDKFQKKKSNTNETMIAFLSDTASQHLAKYY